MRESNTSIPPANRASASITTALYDRRALDCTSSLPLINSLSHLAYLTASSARIRDILAVDGGLERLVCFLKEGRSSTLYGAWKWNLAFQCLVNLGVRGSEAVRKRVVEADAVPVIATILHNYSVGGGRRLTDDRSERKDQEWLNDRTRDLAIHMSTSDAGLRRSFIDVYQQRPRVMLNAAEATRDSDDRPASDEALSRHAAERLGEPINSRNFSSDTGMANGLQCLHEKTITNPIERSNHSMTPINSICNTQSTSSELSRPLMPHRQAGVRETFECRSPMASLEHSSSSNAKSQSSGSKRAAEPYPPVSTQSTQATIVNSSNHLSEVFANQQDLAPSMRQSLIEISTDSPSTNDLAMVRQQDSGDIRGDSGHGVVRPDLPISAISRFVSAEHLPNVTEPDTHNFVSDEDTYPRQPLRPSEDDQHDISMGELFDVGNILVDRDGHIEDMTDIMLLDSVAEYAPTSDAANVEVDMNHPLEAHFDSSSPTTPRAEDVLMSLQLLAYISKYSSQRLSFQHSRLVPSLRIDPHSICNLEDSIELRTDSIENEYLFPDDLNVFPIVEKYTTYTHSPEIQHWAGVVMRNLCRKDDDKGGIRQCAHHFCGSWEQAPRQFAKCRRCRRTKYCSKECQKKAWSYHRYWCSAIQPKVEVLD